MTLGVSRALPSPRSVDGTTNTESPRASGYGEQYVMPFGPRIAADEGSYFFGTNVTLGTGVAGHAAPTTMDNTKPFVMFKNGAESGGKRVYLDYLKLTVTAAGTAGTLNYATHLLDSGAGFTSGGGVLTMTNPNGEGLALAEVNTIYCGAVVATAGSAQRVVGHQLVRTVIPVVGDEIIFDFSSGLGLPAGAPTEGTLQVSRVIRCAPVILAPQQWYKLVLWRASQSAAASYEVEIGGWVR